MFIFFPGSLISPLLQSLSVSRTKRLRLPPELFMARSTQADGAEVATTEAQFVIGVRDGWETACVCVELKAYLFLYCVAVLGLRSFDSGQSRC